PRIVEKGLASDAAVIQTVIAKYCDHLPLYRQQAILQREAGVEISRATLDGWVMRVASCSRRSSERCVRTFFAHPIYKPMKPRCRCRCRINAGPIIKRIYGNTESPAAKRCSSFKWAAGALVHRSFWGSGKGFCKPTDIRFMTTSAGKSW